MTDEKADVERGFDQHGFETLMVRSQVNEINEDVLEQIATRVVEKLLEHLDV